MTSDQWMERDRGRRETVERYHRLKDIEEDFVVAKQAAKTREERQRLMNEMGAYRQKHRQEDVARGKRVPGGRIQMHAIMWPRWIEVAVNHEMAAREIYAELVEAGRIGSGRNLTSRLSQSPPPPARSRPCTQMLCT